MLLQRVMILELEEDKTFGLSEARMMVTDGEITKEGKE